MRTTQRKGDIALAKAISSMTQAGHDVSLPLTESAAYDLVVDLDNKLYRVQVKYSSEQDVDLRSIHSNAAGYVVKKTRELAYDWLYVLKDDGKEYLFKMCFQNRRSVRPQQTDLLELVLSVK